MELVDLNSDSFLKELEEKYPEKYLITIGLDKFQLFTLNTFVGQNSSTADLFDPNDYKLYLDKMWRVF